jgi:hypothetical protein
MTYAAIGMQGLVDAIRQSETGAVKHLILLGGIAFSNDLSQWLAYEPNDPAGNLAAAWHIYNFNPCNNATCYNGAPAAVAAMVPIVATEIGERDCNSMFISPLMLWLDAKGSSYLAWSWNAYGGCQPTASPWSLVTDYYSGTPNSTYAQTFHDHIMAF